MVDILGAYLNYQQASLRNQAMEQDIAGQQRMRPIIEEEAGIKLESERMGLERQQQISKILGQARPTAPSELAAPQPTAGDRLIQQSNTLLGLGGQLISAGDIKSGGDLIAEGRQLQTLALEQQRIKWNEQSKQHDQVYQWASAINNQESLDTVKTLVEAEYPGTWKQLRIPDVYDPQTAKIFQTIAQASLNSKERADLELRQIELKTAPAYFKARTEAAEASAVKERIDAALAREKLKEKTEQDKIKPNQVKFDAELAKENMRYSTDLAKQEQSILRDTKKYPTEIPETGYVREKLGSLFGETPAEKISPRDKALQDVRQAAQTAHQRNLQAIADKYSKTGVDMSALVSTTGTQQPLISNVPNKSVNDILADYRKNNPNATDDEIISDAKNRGYLK